MKYRHKEIPARIEADKIIQARFAPSLGITTFEGYLDHVDLISTCHLSPALAAHVIATTRSKDTQVVGTRICVFLGLSPGPVKPSRVIS